MLSITSILNRELLTVKGWSILRGSHLLTSLLVCGVSLASAQSDFGHFLFVDPLSPGDHRPAGTALDKQPLFQGDTAWRANKGVTVSTNGVTASGPGGSGAHHALPAVAGTVRVQADLCPAGSGFTGLAVGRGDLSGNFWVNCEILFYAHANQCGLLVGKLDWSPTLNEAALKLTAPTNRLELLVDTLARTLTLRVNGAIALDAAPLPPTIRVNNLTAAGFRFNEPVSAGRPSVSGYRAEAVNIATSGLQPVDLGMVLVTPDAPAVLRWKAGLRGQSTRVPYIVRDYTGSEEAKADAALDSDGSVTVTRAFARGYHEIVFPEADQTFGILSLEPHTGSADPFFGIDAALTMLETRPAARTNLVACLKRTGIAIARERLSLGSISPKPGVFNWDATERRPESMRAIYREAGVEVLDSLWGVTKSLEPGLNNKHPQNLVETAAAWSPIVARFGSGWGAYEVGNEPDLDLPAMPADQYAAVVKAGAFASDRTAPRKPVIAGAFATVPPGLYFEACAANGLLDCVDGLSFHQYDRAPAMQSQVQAYRDFMSAHGKPGLPLWLTECGHYWALGPDRPPRDQDADSAREISAKAVEARACGIHSFFPFVMPFYEEGGSKSFSLFGREVTPLRSYAAYAACASALSGRDYCGDLRTDDPNVRLSRVFAGKDGVHVAVLYSDKLDSGLSVRLPVVPRLVTGADGRTLPAAADGTAPLPDALGYVWFASEPPEGALIRDTPAARLLATSRQTVPVRGAASPVVLQFPYSAALGQISKRAYHVTQATAAALPITVRVQNMGDIALTVAPVLHLPGPQPRQLPHDALTVQPHAIASASWTVDATAALDVCEIRHLSVTATCEQAPGILPLALPMLVDGQLDEILARFPKQERIPIDETARWKVRTGGGTQNFSSPDGKTWRMDMTFLHLGDAWAYPYFTLPGPIDPKVFSGIVLRARAMKKASNNMLILVEEKDRREIRASDLYVADGQWHSVYVPFDQLRYFTAGMQNEPLRLDRISTLSVGLVSRELANTLEVSDLILVGTGTAHN